MSNFCLQCGAEVPANAAFCRKCGVRLNQGPSSNPAPLPAGTPKSKLSAAKIFLIILGLMVVFGILCIGELVYAGYKMTVKAKDIVHSSQSSSADSVLASSPAEKPNPEAQISQKDACTLVTKDEVAQATGASIADAAPNEDKDLCTYTPSEGQIAAVTVQVNWQGGRLAMRAFPTITQDAIGHDIRQPVPGIGDEAYILGVDDKTQQTFDQIPEQYKTLASFATGPLMFRKGDVWVTVTATLAKNKADAEKKIAWLVARRI